MPARQLHRQLEKSLGANWKSRIASFDETPIAAASIGQVGVMGVAKIKRVAEDGSLARAVCDRFANINHIVLGDTEAEPTVCPDSG